MSLTKTTERIKLVWALREKHGYRAANKLDTDFQRELQNRLDDIKYAKQ